MTPKTQPAVKLPELPEPFLMKGEPVHTNEGGLFQDYYTAEQMHAYALAHAAAAPADAGGVVTEEMVGNAERWLEDNAFRNGTDMGEWGVYRCDLRPLLAAAFATTKDAP